ncbi:hypothetical protein ACJ73_01824 [Blastomyces percursus]|uniref:Uncharacterized protein n=1 Tax=Blastomyces percursus TaxID=1658174 RepID=A0A1J9QE48_9EURO|nr:hypothetical protein ACJ73_01824 [Blastomyces percursus]
MPKVVRSTKLALANMRLECPEPWMAGHCAWAPKFLLLAGIVLQFLDDALDQPADSLKMLLTALAVGMPGIPMDDFVKAVAADTCVSDEDTVANSNALGRSYSRAGSVFSIPILAQALKTQRSCNGKSLMATLNFTEMRARDKDA